MRMTICHPQNTNQGSQRQTGAPGWCAERCRTTWPGARYRRKRRSPARMERTEPPESGPGQVEVQRREDELPCDDIPDEEPDDAPKHGGDCRVLHDVVGIGVLIDGFTLLNALPAMKMAPSKENGQGYPVQLDHRVRRFQTYERSEGHSREVTARPPYRRERRPPLFCSRLPFDFLP